MMRMLKMTSEPIPKTVERFEKILDRYKNKPNYDKFRKWLMSKSHLPYMFPARMYRFCYRIYDRIYKTDGDFCICVTGYEGVGKSTIAFLIAILISDNLEKKNFVYTCEDFLQLVEKGKRGDTILIDEGNAFLFSREAMKPENVGALKTFAEQRALGYNTIVCAPNYWTIDSKARPRFRAVIFAREVKKNGRSTFRFRCINKKGVDHMNKPKNVNIPLMSQRFTRRMFFDSTWYVYGDKIPKINDITWGEYDTYKKSSVRDNVRERRLKLMKKNGKVREKEAAQEKKASYISLAEATKIFPLDRRTIVSRIKKGELDGKKFGSKWFVNKNEFQNE